MFDRLGAETKADTTTGNKVSRRWRSHSERSHSCLPWVLFLILPTSPSLQALGPPRPPFQPQFPSLHWWLPCLSAAPTSDCQADSWMPPWARPTIMSQTGLSLFPQSDSSPGPHLRDPPHCPHSRQSPVQWRHLSRLVSHLPVWTGRWSPNWSLCSCCEPLQPFSHSSNVCRPQDGPPVSPWKPFRGLSPCSG